MTLGAKAAAQHASQEKQTDRRRLGEKYLEEKSEAETVPQHLQDRVVLSARRLRQVGALVDATDRLLRPRATLLPGHKAVLVSSRFMQVTNHSWVAWFVERGGGVRARMQRERRGGGAKTRDRKTISNSCTVLGCTVGWTRDEGGGGGETRRCLL